MITATEARARVQLGATFLDQARPDWAQRIDVGTLTLHDPCGCIVGQLCGVGRFAFLTGVRSLAQLYDTDAAEAFAIAHGMELDDAEYDGAIETEFDDPRRVPPFKPLQDAWVEAIADRLVTGDEHGADVGVQAASSPVRTL